MSSLFSTTAAAVAAATPSPATSTEHNHARNGAFNSGGYIYMILLAGVLTGAIYFLRVCLAKRQARHRALKNPDFEGPPTYLHHLQDLQIIDARPRTTAASGQLVVPSAPASALIRGENYYIVTPRTHSRTGSAASSLSRPRSSAPGFPGTGAASPLASAAAGSPLNTTTSATTTTIALSGATASTEPLPPAYEDLGPGATVLLDSTPLVAPSAPPLTGPSAV